MSLIKTDFIFDILILMEFWVLWWAVLQYAGDLEDYILCLNRMQKILQNIPLHLPANLVG